MLHKPQGAVSKRKVEEKDIADFMRILLMHPQGIAWLSILDHFKLLGYLSHSVEQLLWVGICRCALTSSY